jgi:hypothetical protein
MAHSSAEKAIDPDWFSRRRKVGRGAVQVLRRGYATLIQILSRVDSIVADSYFTEPLRPLFQQYRPICDMMAKSSNFRKRGDFVEKVRVLARRADVSLSHHAPATKDRP